jgi:D-alanyl-lipoteichoic acid acyltransferase DltB (MBOAT superfamily)
MAFNSYGFLLIFLPLALLLWELLDSRWRLQYLFVLSLIFYGLADPRILSWLLGLAVITWGGGLILARWPHRYVTIGTVGVSLLPLLSVKYLDFGLSAVSQLLQVRIDLLHLLMPVGLSFYTFQSVSYLLEVAQGKFPASRAPLPVFLYISFFPTLIAGPILRYDKTAPQFHAVQTGESTTSDEMRYQALLLIVTGLCRKVLVADALAVQVNRLLADPQQLGTLSAWAAMVGFAFQVYYDFSGYSLIAQGIALWFGIRIPANFNRPYTARNVSEFWQRWHISLSSWLRDYLFLPISRSLLRRWDGKHTVVILVIAQLTTMSLAGVWHGAGWMFLIWGIYHALLLIWHNQTRRWNIMRWSWLSAALTFIAILIGWVWFRSETPTMALTILSRLFNPAYLESPSLIVSTIGWRLIGLLLIGAVWEWSQRGQWISSIRQRWIWVVGVAFLLTLVLLSMGSTQQFLYFRF